MSKSKIKPTVSIIISTYNRPSALSLCLQSVAKQTVLPTEVVIGDDGSKPETRELIDSFKKIFPVPIIHIWQEDIGFRLAMARNKSVARCSSDYIIEIDGDLILHPQFVHDHLYFAKKGYLLKGGRVNLDERLTEKLCRTQTLPHLNFWSKGLLRRINAINCLPLSRYLAPRYKKGRLLGLGCNMSFWREDFIKVNGYDEFYEGWGGEDYDLVYRLHCSGVKRLYLKFSGIVYHLWHNDVNMYNKEKNNDYFIKRLSTGGTNWRTDNGVDKYL